MKQPGPKKGPPQLPFALLARRFPDPPRPASRGFCLVEVESSSVRIVFRCYVRPMRAGGLLTIVEGYLLYLHSFLFFDPLHVTTRPYRSSICSFPSAPASTRPTFLPIASPHRQDSAGISFLVSPFRRWSSPGWALSCEFLDPVLFSTVAGLLWRPKEILTRLGPSFGKTRFSASR